ncbi:putative gamma-glutamylcyclotransferase CG2811 [Drosophila eugracilis]|uniref:putative gamma-glutamylcyclotransferase CG2811 n=1 Tax=Drosophila eugracilis TaxID=29029 RepID=UPI0007E6024C|nr:putative gamma-glutamylcyclotransferase CG2811 [Drosophila eugracilis]
MAARRRSGELRRLGNQYLSELIKQMAGSAECLRMAARVFVYGTLKRGEPNHQWLTKKENGQAKYLGKGITAIKFPLVVGTRYNIPFLLACPGVGNNIEGEVYEVDQAMFSKLDELEDYPNYYDREEQTILVEENETTQCWLYLIRNFPDKMLTKELLTSYHNTPEQPYSENYLDSCPDDLVMDD